MVKAIPYQLWAQDGSNSGPEDDRTPLAAAIGSMKSESEASRGLGRAMLAGKLGRRAVSHFSASEASVGPRVSSDPVAYCRRWALSLGNIYIWYPLYRRGDIYHILITTILILDDRLSCVAAPYIQ